jgi:hypothetical protein
MPVPVGTGVFEQATTIILKGEIITRTTDKDSYFKISKHYTTCHKIYSDDVKWELISKSRDIFCRLILLLPPHFQFEKIVIILSHK